MASRKVPTFVCLFLIALGSGKCILRALERKSRSLMKWWCRTFNKEPGHGFRKQLGVMFLIASALALSECGGSRNGPPQLIGDWTANLLACSGCSPTWSFNLTLVQGISSTLILTNFDNHLFSSCCTLMFIQYPHCIAPIDTELGTTILGTGKLSVTSGASQNVTSGAFQMVFSSPPAVGTVHVSLQGTLTNNVVTGTWTATGSGFRNGCSVAGSGDFTMTNTGS